MQSALVNCFFIQLGQAIRSIWEYNENLGTKLGTKILLVVENFSLSQWAGVGIIQIPIDF